MITDVVEDDPTVNILDCLQDGLSSDVATLDLLQGSSARLHATLSMGAQPVDGTIVLLVKDPSGEILTPSVVRPSTGVYYTDVEADLPGVWRFRWQSSNPGSAAEGSFRVRRSQVI